MILVLPIYGSHLHLVPQSLVYSIQDSSPQNQQVTSKMEQLLILPMDPDPLKEQLDKMLHPLLEFQPPLFSEKSQLNQEFLSSLLHSMEF